MRKKKPKSKTPAKIGRPKKRINSRAKGKVGELEFVNFLKDRGIEARRGQQYAGGGDSPDVMASGCFAEVHVEVKRKESGNVYDWLDQAANDADLCSVPVVAHRRNGKRWIAIIDMRDFINIVKENTDAKEKIKNFDRALGEAISHGMSEGFGIKLANGEEHS